MATEGLMKDSTCVKNHDQSSTSISKVRVILRVRPFLAHELSQSSCVSRMDKSSELEVNVLIQDHQTSRNECYKLDDFFGQEDNNVSKIFEREVRPLIPGLFQGYNATVFAYGATGSGKTYTMQGSNQLPGLMPLAMSNILSMCNHTGSTITVSYYEIYLDKCYDLLEPKEKEIMVWNDKDEKIHLKGLAQMEVNSMSEFHEIFSSALERRKVAQTGLNDVSSRSHGVLVINISTPSHDNVERVVMGKLNLIDLAGNEDNRKTCNEGIRLQESAKINQSLFALSNVIYALNNSMPRIPYRESKLTRILQDSLGGTSRALMVACLNPGDYQESVYTVSLAARSRHVSNFVSSAQKNTNSKVKVDMEAKLRAWLDSRGKTKNAQRPGLLQSPFTGKTPGSITSARKLKPSASEMKAVRNLGALDPKQRTPSTTARNLFDGRDRADPCQEAQCFSADDTIKKIFAFKVGDASELKTAKPEESRTEDENARDISHNTICSSPVKEKTTTLQSPQRKVLSPINSNTPVHNTPKFHSLSCNEENGSEMIGTPLDKFTAHSSSLKSSFVQDYIELLNTASREELLELKGIGQKMAEYIIELRETSPLKALSDLEKIGLSSKQVHNMFGRAARGVFEKLVHNV